MESIDSSPASIIAPRTAAISTPIIIFLRVFESGVAIIAMPVIMALVTSSMPHEPRENEKNTPPSTINRDIPVIT